LWIVDVARNFQECHVMGSCSEKGSSSMPVMAKVLEMAKFKQTDSFE